MNFSQMMDQRPLAFDENVPRQVALDAGSRLGFDSDGLLPTRTSFAKKWIGGGSRSRRLIGPEFLHRFTNWSQSALIISKCRESARFGAATEPDMHGSTSCHITFER